MKKAKRINLAFFKKLLLDKKKKLAKVITREKIELEVGDNLDFAEYDLEKETAFCLTDTERKILSDIENALYKIKVKTYGVCEICKKNIPIERLKALPWARYCISCQKKSETETLEEEEISPSEPSS